MSRRVPTQLGAFACGPRGTTVTQGTEVVTGAIWYEGAPTPGSLFVVPAVMHCRASSGADTRRVPDIAPVAVPPHPMRGSRHFRLPSPCHSAFISIPVPCRLRRRPSRTVWSRRFWMTSNRSTALFDGPPRSQRWSAGRRSWPRSSDLRGPAPVGREVVVVARRSPENKTPRAGEIPAAVPMSSEERVPS